MPDYDDGLVEAVAKALEPLVGEPFRAEFAEELARAAIAAVLEWQGKKVATPDQIAAAAAVISGYNDDYESAEDAATRLLGTVQWAPGVLVDRGSSGRSG